MITENVILFDENKTKEERLLTCKRFLKLANIDVSVCNFLDSMNFFDAPASSKYHGNYEGGLFDHSITVAQMLIEFTNTLKLNWKDNRSPIIVGLFHDLCKCDAYIKDGANFHYNPNQILIGHADKSIALISQFMTLTDEEILCIRYHMGAFANEDKERSAYGNAVKVCENVLWTHTADMYSSRIFGI